MTTQLQAYAWLPEGTIGIGAQTPRGAFMIAAAPLDTLYEAIKTTACRDNPVTGCYSLPGLSDTAGGNSHAAVTAFVAYRRTVRAHLSINRDGRRPGSRGNPRTRRNEN